jgi:hypothetical protein
MVAKSAEAQRVLSELDAELATAAKTAGRELVWSAAERTVYGTGQTVDVPEDVVDKWI